MKMSCCSYMMNLYNKLSNMTKGWVGSALVPAWLELNKLVFSQKENNHTREAELPD